MAVKARATITVAWERDILAIYRFYKIASSTSTPSTPTVAEGQTFINSGTVPSGWSKVEPAYDGTSTNSLYIIDLTSFSDGDVIWSDISKSSSYEASKQAYNKATANETAISKLQPELIVGTHGTTATATWTGTSTVLTEIVAGTRIQFKMTSAGASNVTLNLTLKGGGTTGAKNVYYSNTTRLGTQYGVNNILDLIYDGTSWRILNPYTNSNTVGSYGGIVKAGTNGVRPYGLVMKTAEDAWSSFTTSATTGTGTTKTKYTGGYILSSIMYNGNNSTYNSGSYTGSCYSSIGLDLRYSTNCGSTLTKGLETYLVGTINETDGLFYLDDTWWTQTKPTTEDGKVYIYLGVAYSTYQIYLSSDNPAYMFDDDSFKMLSDIRTSMTAIATSQNALNEALEEYVPNTTFDDTVNNIVERMANNENAITNVGGLLSQYTPLGDFNALDQYLDTYIGQNGRLNIVNDGLVIKSETTSLYEVVITNEAIIFKYNGQEVASLTNTTLHITNSIVEYEQRMGNFRFVPREGRLTLMKV